MWLRLGLFNTYNESVRGGKKEGKLIKSHVRKHHLQLSGKYKIIFLQYTNCKKRNHEIEKQTYAQ